MTYIQKYNILISTLLAAFICLAGTLHAAEKAARQPAEAPDFEAIKAATLNPAGEFYYPKLFKQFMSNDTLMSADDYRHLYYGYVFQEDYDPYRRSKHADRVEKLYYKTDHSKEECDTIMKYAELSLADNPFDLRQMMFLIIALKEKQKHARAAIWQFRLNHLVGAIMSSGNGTKEMPWYVISPVHEYNLLNFMKYIATEHQDIDDGTIDYLKVQRTDDESKSSGSTSPEGFYFNVAEIARVFGDRFAEPQ